MKLKSLIADAKTTEDHVAADAFGAHNREMLRWRSIEVIHARNRIGGRPSSSTP